MGDHELTPMNSPMVEEFTLIYQRFAAIVKCSYIGKTLYWYETIPREGYYVINYVIKPVETTRYTSVLADENIVRSVWRHTEADRND